MIGNERRKRGEKKRKMWGDERERVRERKRKGAVEGKGRGE